MKNKVKRVFIQIKMKITKKTPINRMMRLIKLPK